MNFNGKTLLVTGAAHRVGAEIARYAAQKGAHVVVHCRDHRREAEALLAALPGAGHRVFAADFAEPEGADQLFDFCGQVDILVNNASLYFHTPADGVAADAETMQVNFYAPRQLMRRFAAQEIAVGCVVNILDQEIFTPGFPRGAYSKSRKLLAAETLRFAREYGVKNLRFNAVAPGPMLPPAGWESSQMRRTLPTLPLRRKVEIPDLCAAIGFLVENESITGAILPVDCGQSLADSQLLEEFVRDKAE